MKTFKLKLVFDDLRRKGQSIYGTIEYIDATMGDLHSGSTFPGTITLDADTAYDFQAIMDSGLQVVFWVVPEAGQ